MTGSWSPQDWPQLAGSALVTVLLAHADEGDDSPGSVSGSGR